MELHAEIESFKNHQEPYESYLKKAKVRLQEEGISFKCVGKSNLARCYESYTYEVLGKENISKELLFSMRKLGLLGWGQEFYIREFSQDRAVVETRCDSSD